MKGGTLNVVRGFIINQGACRAMELLFLARKGHGIVMGATVAVYCTL